MKESLLVRFRERDSGEGITRKTLRHIAKALGLSETQAVHRALVEYARKFVPLYLEDEGALTDAQCRRIAHTARQQHGAATVKKSLFDEPQRKPAARGMKRVSAGRNR